MIQVIDDSQFAQTVLEAENTVLAYFWAAWCGPCRLMGPILEGAAAKYGDRLTVVKLEVDANPESVKQCKVEGVPALRLYRNGECLDASEGAISRDRLIAFLDPHLAPVSS